MKKLTNKKGFTLIEMLVVIAIIAVLVAIIIPTVTSATAKAAAATNAANLRSYKAELVTSYLANGEEQLADIDIPEMKDVGDVKAAGNNALVVHYYIDKTAGVNDITVWVTVGGTAGASTSEPPAGTADAPLYGIDYYADIAENGLPAD